MKAASYYLYLEWIVEVARVVQNHNVTHVNLGHATLYYVLDLQSAIYILQSLKIFFYFKAMSKYFINV